MNTKKKIFTKLALVFALVILASLFFVGCGSNNGGNNTANTPTQPEEPLVFDECLELTEATTYGDTTSTPTTVDELKNFAKYKIVTFTAKKDFSFYMFSFKIINEAYTVSMGQGYTSHITALLKTPTQIGDVGYYPTSPDPIEGTHPYYYRHFPSLKEDSFSPIENTNIPSVATKMSISKGENVILDFQEKNSFSSNEYRYPISLYDFILK